MRPAPARPPWCPWCAAEGYTLGTVRHVPRQAQGAQTVHPWDGGGWACDGCGVRAPCDAWEAAQRWFAERRCLPAGAPFEAPAEGAEPWCAPERRPDRGGRSPRLEFPLTGPLAERFYRAPGAPPCFNRLSALFYWPPPGFGPPEDADDEAGDTLMAAVEARIAELDAGRCQAWPSAPA